jgi:16S rRNA (cytosine967-C5)-methyltransferase
MFAAVRYGLLAVFLEDDEPLPTSLGDAKLHTRLEAFHARYPDLDALQAAWKRMEGGAFFASVCQRHLTELRMGSSFEFDRDGRDEASLAEVLAATLDMEPACAKASSKLEAFESLSDAASSCFKAAAHAETSLLVPLRVLLLRAGIPLWFAAPLLERWRTSGWSGATVERFLSLQNSRSPLWLRMNYPERAQEVVAELRKEAFDTVAIGEAAIQATGAKGIFATEGYRNGLFEIQDLASQGIGQAVANAPGETVWDCCAGGGGKTMQIAARAKNKGVVYASDVREYKLEEVKKRARRAGFFNIRCVPWQGDALPAFPKEIERRSGFDWVLVDAPCSSAGTWRRNPDAKYRTQEKNIENLGELQLRLLTNASKAVRPGGHLVYSTCSWIVDENEGIAARFLASQPQFRLKHQTLLGAPETDADTMFVAVFVSASTPS